MYWRYFFMVRKEWIIKNKIGYYNAGSKGYTGRWFKNNAVYFSQ